MVAVGRRRAGFGSGRFECSGGGGSVERAKRNKESPAERRSNDYSGCLPECAARAGSCLREEGVGQVSRCDEKAELITQQVSGAVAFGDACPVLRRRVCDCGARWMQGGLGMGAQTTSDGLGPKTRQRLNWRQTRPEVGDDETRTERIAGGVHGGLTHLWTREAWNQAAGCLPRGRGS